MNIALVFIVGFLGLLALGGAAFVFTEERLRNELAPRLHDIALTIARDIGGHVPTPSSG